LEPPAAATPAALPDFARLVERCGPAVVNISTQQSALYGPQDFGGDEGIPEDSPLYDFFRRFFGDEGEVPQDIDPGRSLGSGFFVSDDGYVLTNAHVVEAADEIIVRTSDRREFLAQVIGADERSDSPEKARPGPSTCLVTLYFQPPSEQQEASVEVTSKSYSRREAVPVSRPSWVMRPPYTGPVVKSRRETSDLSNLIRQPEQTNCCQV
jgi:hypothetical protein